MDADDPGPPQGHRLSWLKAAAIKAVAVVMLFLVVPPLAWLAGDLWSLARVADERGNVEEARSLLLRGVIESADRVAEWRGLHRLWGPEAAPGHGPTILYQPPPRGAEELIPLCPAGGGGVRASGVSPRMAADSARFMLTRARLGTAGTVALDVCLNATPFAGRCERRLRRAQEFTIEEIAAEAVRLKYALRDSARTCWCRSVLCADEGA